MSRLSVFKLHQRRAAVIAILFVIFSLGVLPPVFSETDSMSAQALLKLKSLETQLADVKKSQTSILATQDQIIEEIKGLKIWVNKHRGGKN